MELIYRHRLVLIFRAPLNCQKPRPHLFAMTKGRLLFANFWNNILPYTILIIVSRFWMLTMSRQCCRSLCPICRLQIIKTGKLKKKSFIIYFKISFFDRMPQQYISSNRNLLRVRDLEQRSRHLKVGRLPVVSFLSELPATKHDPATMSVDLTLLTVSILSANL